VLQQIILYPYAAAQFEAACGVQVKADKHMPDSMKNLALEYKKETLQNSLVLICFRICCCL
jgi:outer membrane lipopolysaccharide assembly protein LptE/RlpB